MQTQGRFPEVVKGKERWLPNTHPPSPSSLLCCALPGWTGWTDLWTQNPIRTLPSEAGETCGQCVQKQAAHTCAGGKPAPAAPRDTQGKHGIQLQGDSCCPGRSGAEGVYAEHHAGPESQEVSACLGKPKGSDRVSSPHHKPSGSREQR